MGEQSMGDWKLSDEVKQRILDSARQLVVQNGFSNLSISKVAHEANISKSQVYYYFISKLDLIGQMIDEQIEEYMFVKNLIDDADNVSEKIEILFSYIKKPLNDMNDIYTNGSMLLHFAVETVGDDPVLNEKNRKLGRLIFEDISFLIAVSNIFSKNDDENDYAKKVLAMILGALVVDQVLVSQVATKYIQDELTIKLTN
ncbi:TetR/AcrR family transcriptional regulator [Weissella muntiaci]|uniref:TetR/AcrR family transcriptional regulator n=1 Tax=Weissella muntiaci TaxID=2508881 RepID=A0A6C2C916_9LACO|nr:TetR/AcrR family transcriptional regulator [Weissella muntiaci]TYC50530.1 TetR/AcrR family transcriptional regulator [Weissella muntiaci]